MNPITYTPGKYQAKIKDYGWTEAQTGTPQFFVQFEVFGKYDQSGNVVDCPRFERTFYRAISKKSEEAKRICASMLRADLTSINVKIEDEAQLDPQQPNAVNLFGRKIDVHLTLEPYNGKTTERWNLRSSKRQKLSTNELRSKLGGGGLFRSDNGPPPPAVPPDTDDTPY